LKSNSLDFPNVTRMQRDFLHLHFFFRFILKRIFGYTLKCSIHIETFFCRSLKVGYVSLSSTPCLCFLLRNLKLIKWRQWGIFYSRDQHESGTFPPQHFRKCTFYEMFSNVRKMHVMKREESSCHEKGRIILPLDYCLHQHLSCSPTQQMGSFQGQMDLPAN
jgi:hypothetical protein